MKKGELVFIVSRLVNDNYEKGKDMRNNKEVLKSEAGHSCRVFFSFFVNKKVSRWHSLLSRHKIFDAVVSFH